MAEDKQFQAKMKAFDNAAAWGRLVATLAAATIALSVTFLRDIVGPSGAVMPCLLIGAWVLLFLAVLFGTLYVGAISEYLFITPPDKLSIRDSAFMPWAYIEQFAFWIGLILLLVFAGLNLS